MGVIRSQKGISACIEIIIIIVSDKEFSPVTKATRIVIKGL